MNRLSAAGFPNPSFVDAASIRLAAYETGASGPAVILVHGWPEIAYSWKHQMQPLATAGFRPIAIDLKGFGASDSPRDAALYDNRHMTDDLAALLDALGLEKAIFCGHDWGGALVWAMAQHYPDRVAGVISVSTPLKPRAPAPPLDIIRKRLGEQHYFVRFQTPDEPERLFESDVEGFFRLMFRKPAPREQWPALVPRVYDLMGRMAHGGAVPDDRLVLPPSDLAVYIDAYRRSGFHGGVNLYRNINRNWETLAGRDERIAAPALWVGAELDLFLPPESAVGMEKIVADLEQYVISGCGHWVMWEKPAELNAIITDWLRRRMR